MEKSGIISHIQNIKKVSLDLLFPPLCLGCGKEGNFLCASCAGALSFIPPACFGCGAFSPGTAHAAPGRTCASCRQKSRIIYGFISPFSYENAHVRAIVHGCKYARLPTLGTLMGEYMAAYVNRFSILLSARILVLPIPLHRRKMRERGFNQADIIAESFSRIIRLECARGFLSRKKYTNPQVSLSPEMRRVNMEDAFLVLDKEQARGRDILLIDDVKTTGSTISAAAHALKRAGAKRIWAGTFAR